MNQQHGIYRFWTTPPVTNREEGFTALRLHRETDRHTGVTDGRIGVVAEVVYCDATGHYYLQTFNGEAVPLEIIEPLIAEAKETIKYK